MSTRRPSQVLELFNEHAETLDRRAFVTYVRGNSLGWIGSVVDAEMALRENGPSEDEVAAFVLTMRFFVQDNEPTSIRRIARLYEDLPVSELLRDQMREARETVNRLLDGPSRITIASEHLTNRQIFETFMWGGLAHSNSEHKNRYDSWRSRSGLDPASRTPS